MIDFNKSNLAKNLPDAFAKDTDSNNYKILENERAAIEEHLSDLYSIYEILNLDNAYGETLDLYGERVGQERGEATDEQYILLLKAKIARSFGNGTYTSVISALCEVLGCDASDIHIEEADEPCTISNIVFPFDMLDDSGISAEKFAEMVKSLLPICVTLENISFNMEVEIEGEAYIASGVVYADEFLITNDFNESVEVTAEAYAAGGVVYADEFLITNDFNESVEVTAEAYAAGGVVYADEFLITNDTE